MKKILTRFSILIVLTTMMAWISSDDQAKAFDCVSVSAMWDAMATCDSNFWTGASPHYDVIQNTPNHCNQYATQQCQSLLGQPGYQACYDQAYNECVANADNSYSNAIYSYGSCLSAAVNPSCFETLEFCPGARDRAAQCEAFVNDDCCVYSDCLNASGVWQCQ